MTRDSDMADEFDEFCAINGGSPRSSPPLQCDNVLNGNSPPSRSDDCTFSHDVEYVQPPSPRVSPTGSTSNVGCSVPPDGFINGRHNRSVSCKKTRSRPKNLELEEIRPRTSSMPTKNSFKKPTSNYLSPAFQYDNDNECYRVRSFTTSSKGIKNRGDSFKRNKSKSNTSVASSNGSCECGTTTVDNDGTPQTVGSNQTSACSSVSDGYTVLITGYTGVGKTSITQQFMTSEYLGPSVDDSNIDTESTEMSVSVLLDKEESTMNFLEDQGQNVLNDVGADAYVIVYSVTDRPSFDYVTDLLYRLRKEEQKSSAIIIVGNKSDLARLRQIPTEEGRAAASTYECKFIETSAVLNHQVDELLVGTLSQIRLHEKKLGKNSRRSKKCHNNNNNIVHKAAKGLITKFFKHSSPPSKSCDNLFQL